MGTPSRLRPKPSQPLIFGNDNINEKGSGGAQTMHTESKNRVESLSPPIGQDAEPPSDEVDHLKESDNFEDDLWNEEAMQLADIVEGEGG